MSNKKQNTNNKEYSARLMAVQAYYQNVHDNKPLRIVIEECLNRGKPVDTDGDDLCAPDKMLFKKIVSGVDTHLAQIDEMLKAHKSGKELEPLLRSILMCSIGEILFNPEIDAPLIINDYLNITHDFYEKQQVSLVNAVLDNVAKALRPL